VDRHSADAIAALDDGDSLAELGRLDGGTLAAGAGADDEEVEISGGHGPLSYHLARAAATARV
jgi:hypothetical protein